MKENFDRAFDMVCQFEGYTSALKNDPGGLTIWGISEKWYPEEVKKMSSMSPNQSKEHAKQIYKREYWDKLDADNLSTPFDYIAFDTAVNCGVHVAKKILTEVVSSKGDWKDYIFKRLLYYSILISSKPAMRDFLRGWLNRCLSLWGKFK